jgi:nucleoside-diphosphate-sugar epimerase
MSLPFTLSGPLVNRRNRVLVAGAGGFIGGHVVHYLISHGYSDIIAVDVKELSQWHQVVDGATSLQFDLSKIETALVATTGCAAVINLAADMGGMGFIENNRALCMLSVLINTHLLLASRQNHVERYFFASSACVYPAQLQNVADVTALTEETVYPAMPEAGYGWEKLFSEQMCEHFLNDFGLDTRVARYHNVYGPKGTWFGGREKAPAAICRKIAEAVMSGNHQIEIWGDGEQTRSFTFIDDCVEGTLRLMNTTFTSPINIGSSELVTINQLVDIVEGISGIRVERNYDLSAPLGVRGRNSDNTLVRSVLGWEPSTLLRDGLEATYRWIYDEMRHSIISAKH